MSISELYNIRRTLRKKQVRDLDLEGDQEEGGRVQVRADPSTSFLSSEQPSLRVKAEKAATSRKTRICNICYVEQAKYTCPSCNSPYCSLTCFRSKAHVGCSSDFSLKTLKEDGRVSGTRVGEEERLRMLDILKRLETNDQGYHDHMEDDDDVDEEQVEDEGQEEGEEERLKLLESMDLDEATPEQLLSLLSPKERERFQRAISDPKKAQSLMEHLERGAQGLDLNTPSDSEHRSDLEGPELISANSKDPDSTPLPGEPKLSILNRDVGKFNYESRPWWQEGGAEGQPFLSFGKSQARFEGDHGRIDPFDSFSKALRKALASQQLSSNPSSSRSTPSVDLAYNLVTILMTYAYILRYLDIPSLSSLLPKAKPQKLEDAKQKGSEVIRAESEDNGDRTAVMEVASGDGKEKFDEDGEGEEEEEEMPPLEPDTDIETETLAGKPYSAISPRSTSSSPRQASNQVPKLGIQPSTPSLDPLAPPSPSNPAILNLTEEKKQTIQLSLNSIFQLVPLLTHLPQRQRGRAIEDARRSMKGNGATTRTLRKEEGDQDESKRVVNDVESSCLYLLSNLGLERIYGLQADKFLIRLLEDVQVLLRGSKVVDLDLGDRPAGQEDVEESENERDKEREHEIKVNLCKRPKASGCLFDLFNFFDFLIHVFDHHHPNRHPARPQLEPDLLHLDTGSGRRVKKSELVAARQKLIFYTSKFLAKEDASARLDELVDHDVTQEIERLRQTIQREQHNLKVQAAHRLVAGDGGMGSSVFELKTK